MSDSQTPPPLPANIAARFAQLRTSIRAYVLLRGLCLLVAFVLFAFWYVYVVDRLFELPLWGRMALLGVVALQVLLLGIELLFNRLRVPLSDRTLSILLERRFGKFSDSLLTSVELRNRKSEGQFDPKMFAKLESEAEQTASEVSVAQMFRWTPLVYPILAALLLGGTVYGFQRLDPDDFNVFVRRNLYLEENLLWPRDVFLSVVEPARLAEQRFIKVARGDDLTLKVRARLNPDYHRPQYPKFVSLDYRTPQGGRGSETMDLEGQPGQSGQVYTYTFAGLIKDSYTFDVRGGNSELRGLRILVVNSPATANVRLNCTYPRYMGRSPAVLPVSGTMSLPYGTEVLLGAQTTKPVKEVDVTFDLGNGKFAPAESELQADGRSFAVKFRMDAPKNLLITLTDNDGIKNREPERVAIAVQEDATPQIAVRTQGIGTAITPQARIPLLGELTDDYGLTKTWFEFTIDSDPTREQVIPLPVAGTALFKLNDAFDLRALPPRRGGSDGEVETKELPATSAAKKKDYLLKPGQKMTLQLKGQDAYDLSEKKEPNVGASERFFFEIVTEDDLRIILERRELSLRMRFESILSEVLDSRQSLQKVLDDLRTTKGGASIPDAKTTPGSQEEPEEKALTTQQMAEMMFARWLLDMQRAAQNGRKNMTETLSVAQSFEDIVLELINNRVDTEEMKYRLLDEISVPLKKIVEKRFPELEKRLELAQNQLRDSAQSQQAVAGALQAYDVLLRDMNEVLQKMLRLEDFNEALTMLRDIIRGVEEVQTGTREQRTLQLKKDLE